MDQQDADVWNQKRKDKSAGQMMVDQRKKDEIRRLDGKLRDLERELQMVILPDCRRQARKTQAWVNNKNDQAKIRIEIEKLKQKATHNPLSIKSNDQFTEEKILGEKTGKTGEDTVY